MTTLQLPTLLDLADFALATYTEPATIETAEVHALLRHQDGLTWIGLRGTADFEALLRDIAAASERNDPILGKTPNSFASDAEQIFWRVFGRFEGPWVGVGHSKGGSEILDIAAMAGYGGRAPEKVAAFEPAPVGLLNGLLIPDRTVITRHGEDPVPKMPPWRAHPAAVTELPWVGPEPLNWVKWHEMAGVREAVARLPTTGGTA